MCELGFSKRSGADNQPGLPQANGNVSGTVSITREMQSGPMSVFAMDGLTVSGLEGQ